MVLNNNLWQQALSVYNSYKESNSKITRAVLSKELDIIESQARYILFLLENKEIMSGDSYDISVKEKNDFKISQKTNVLLFDIETAPGRAWIWDVWKQNINKDMITDDWFMISWSAKWLFEPEIYSGVLTPDEIRRKDDKRICEEIWQFIDKANIVVAHNSKKFDEKRIRTRFLLHDINPPMPYQTIDTLEVFRKQFAFFHNRLDYVNKIMGLDRKLDTNFELWMKCLDGDENALKMMEKYNRHDVGILEETYVKIRPYIKSHPNLALFVESDSPMCPTCTSTNLSWNGTYATPVNKYSAFRCNDCGSIGRSRVSELNKKQSKNIMAPVAR